MFTKIVFLVTALTAVAAQHHDSHGHGHGHAHSSQSFVLHQSHEHAPAYQHGHHQELHGHQQNNYHGQHGHHTQIHHDSIGNVQGGHYAQLGTQNHLGHLEHHAVQHHGDHQGIHQVYHGHASSSQNNNLHNDGHVTEHVEYYGHPKYEFAYEVHDPHTHDIKHQHEARDGDSVDGVYSLHQPDGRVRTVHYHADDHTGFNADVRYEGHAQHAAPAHHAHHH